MKKLATLSTALMLLFSIASFAEAPKETYDYDAVVTEDFEQLNKIENYVNSNNVTLDELKSEKTNLLEGISLSENASVLVGELPLDIPAFWWGCVLSWVGLILVYVLTDKDKDQTKKALMGCLVGAGFWILLNVGLAVLGSGALFW